MFSEREALKVWEARYLAGLRDALSDACRRVKLPRYRVADHAPGEVADLLAHWSASRELVIWSGASELTVWGDPAGNWQFRAFHDFAHVVTRAGFTAADEIELGFRQCGWAGIDAGPLASIVLEEISEQARYFAERGAFLDGNQIAFALETVGRLEARRLPIRLGR